MISMARELCEKGIGYDSALNLLSSALEILTDIGKKNSCYLSDIKVAYYMKYDLEQFLPMLKDNPKLRLIFDTAKIATSDGEGALIVELTD